ncbi:MAG: hypothetical protein LBT20_00430 [Clostridiales bacterium]|jgi:hypothetical protein|nr:hypothetical protein [Clostridiales bacterium]
MEKFDDFYEEIIYVIDKAFDDLAENFKIEYNVKKIFNKEKDQNKYKNLYEEEIKKLKIQVHEKTVYEKEVLLDRHKISAVMCRIILLLKPIKFNINTLANISKIDENVLFINYRIAFKVGLCYLRYSMLQDFLYYAGNISLEKMETKEEKDCFKNAVRDYVDIDSDKASDIEKKTQYINKYKTAHEALKNANGHLYYPKNAEEQWTEANSKKPRSYIDEMASYLYMNESYGKPFDYLFVANTMYLIEYLNKIALGLVKSPIL